jgi:CRISPR-associated endonuclease/helicase Cas3
MKGLLMNDEVLLLQYWGKANPQTERASWHPLVYHSLDVAASGKIFLQRNDHLRIRLADSLGLQDKDLLLHWMIFFLALHDLGKFSESFQVQVPELFAELHGQPTNRSRSVRHDSLGFLFWQESLGQVVQQENWLGYPADRQGLRSFYKAFDSWMKAVTGHHGKPPSDQHGLILKHYFSDADQDAALAFCRQARDLLLPQEIQLELPPAREFIRRSKHVSWWLAGIAVLADWVGSNQEYFAYTAPMEETPLAEYWHAAQDNAAKALQNAGVLPSITAPPRSLQQLFPDITAATPLQRDMSQLTIGTGPQLFIFEEVTGAGKTEGV